MARVGPQCHRKKKYFKQFVSCNSVIGIHISRNAKWFSKLNSLFFLSVIDFMFNNG